MAQLEERLARADQVVGQQRDGLLEVRAATARKKALREAMRQAHLSHLAHAARVAAREEPDLAKKFLLKPTTGSYLAFRTAARGMAAEAESRKEVLVRHGLVESVLENLNQALDQFDQAVESGREGRATHVGASAELKAVADEVFQVVRVMDGLNRYRFKSDPESLAAWESASNVVASRPAPKPGGPPTPGGEIRPAA
jgi:hypothetical protein